MLIEYAINWEAIGVIAGIIATCTAGLGAWLNQSIERAIQRQTIDFDKQLTDIKAKQTVTDVRLLNLEKEDADILKKVAATDDYAHIAKHDQANLLQRHEARLAVIEESRTATAQICNSLERSIGSSVDRAVDKFLRHGQPDRRSRADD